MAALLVTGTSSDAGKSLIVTGLCRAWARKGIRVAPFKSQNMSNNSMVCQDGAEIGRAQYLQAQAAGVTASSLHNPVLLKPGSDRRAFVVVRGKSAGELQAGEYATSRGHLAETAYSAFEELLEGNDLVVAEGAGSPAEINLRASDYVNMGLARRFNIPTIVVADIDRGGALASLYGTWALLDDDDRALLRGFIMNKFRGDLAVLAPGLTTISERTGMRDFGTMPWLHSAWLDSEDSLSTAQWPKPTQRETLDIAVIRLPRVSNATDVDALAAEPGVGVHVTNDLGHCLDAHLLVIPGSRATVSDLEWLRDTGLAGVIRERVARGKPVLGICGGYQMLGERIEDEIESHAGAVEGLAALQAHTRFGADKVLGRPLGEWRGHSVTGYEIHHGIVSAAATFPGGTHQGNTYGTIWHGTMECDGFRRAWLSEVAVAAGSSWTPAADAPSYGGRRERMIDDLADALATHVDLDALLDVAMNGGAA